MKILFVAMADSVHTARWTNQLAQSGWQIYLFPVYNIAPNPEFKNITIIDGLTSHRPQDIDKSVRMRGIWPIGVGVQQLQFVSRHYIKNDVRSMALAYVIKWLKPDIVHSLEIQNAGYLTYEAKQRLKNKFPKWIVTNWGSDIYLMGRLAEHENRIKQVLESCDYYSCECERDVDLARKFGFTGKVLPVLPNSGGFDIERMHQFQQSGPTSSRKLIVLKGYQGWAGRALVGLRAIELCADMLKGYKVAIYLAAPEVKIAAELVSHSTGIPIEIIPKSPHAEILKLHGMARISIGLSISDAISTSLLEAMVMGSFPIQSYTSCADEWIVDGKSGILVHPDDPDKIAMAIRKAVLEDDLVDNARAINSKVIEDKLEYTAIQSQVIEMYKKLLNNVKNI